MHAPLETLQSTASRAAPLRGYARDIGLHAARVRDSEESPFRGLEHDAIHLSFNKWMRNTYRHRRDAP